MIKIFNSLKSRFYSFKSQDPLKFKQYEDEYGIKLNSSSDQTFNVELSKIKSNSMTMKVFRFEISKLNENITLKIDFGNGQLKYKNSVFHPYSFSIYAVTGFVYDSDFDVKIIISMLYELFKIKFVTSHELEIEKDVKSTSIHD